MSQWDGHERRSRKTDMDQLKSELSEIRIDVRLLLNQVPANHESIRKTTAKIEEILDRHNKTIYGNGVEGITTRVSRIGDLKADLKTHVEEDRRVFLAFGTILVTILVGIGKLVFFK